MLKNIQDEFSKEHEKLGRDLLRNVFSNTDMYRIYFADYEKDEVDFIMFAKTEVLAGDIKCYRSKTYIRTHNCKIDTIKDKKNEYDDYELDADKLEKIEDRAKRINATPILVVFFADCLMIWDLTKTNWRETVYMKEGNKYGSDPTIKEIKPKAKLFFEEAIYKNNKININN